MKKRDAVTAICWIILGLIISIWSATFPFGSWAAIGPAFIPLVCGLTLIFLGSILFFQTRKKRERTPVEAAPLIPQGLAFKRVALSLGGMLLSAVLFERLGFAMTLFFLTLFLLRSIEPQKWRIDVLYTLVFTIGSYLLFQILLGLYLPRSFLGF